MQQNPNTPSTHAHHSFRLEHTQRGEETVRLLSHVREKDTRGTAGKHRAKHSHPSTELPLDLALGRVLIVEDDARMRTFLKAMLSFDGYEVGEFEDVDQLLQHIDSLPSQPGTAPPDLIITDVSMPTAGIELLSYLRWNNWTTPCILLTNPKDDDAIRAETRRWGPLLVMTKPVEAADLTRAVFEFVPPS